MHNSVTLFWGACKVTLMTNNFIISVTSWHLVFKLTYWYLDMGVFNSIMMYMPILHNGLHKSVYKWYLALVCSRVFSSCILKCKHMILAISMHRLTYSPCILKSKTIISSIPICYAFWGHFHLKKWLILTINRCDTLRDL